MFERVQTLLRLDSAYAVQRAYVRAFGTTVKCFPLIKEHIKGRGLEVGGPSSIFKKGHFLPVYPLIDSLDSANFGITTVWEGSISDGGKFRYGDRIGRQMISEAWDLRVPDAHYDFILSCHMLEHTANPLKTLREWHRVVNSDGSLLLVIPDGKRTFDRHRPITTMDHLIQDFENDAQEDDQTHVRESIELHDLSMTPEYPDRATLTSYFMDNIRHRRVHHHVFDFSVSSEMVRHAGFQPLAIETAPPNNIIVFARKA